MGSLIQTFTFDRNTFRRTTEESADSVAEHIGKVRSDATLDKTASNIVGALASYMGIFRREGSQIETTALADVFLKLYAENKADSWQWLVARSLWRFVVPNGTACKVNQPAKERDVNFAFFNILLQLLTHLSAEPGDRRFLFFEELCRLLDDDANWGLSGSQLFVKLELARSAEESGFGSSRGFLDDLEKEFDIPRDNFNGLFSKAFAQTGFFSIKHKSGKAVGVALNPAMDFVLQRRLRFILDHPPDWRPAAGENWTSYLDFHKNNDLPEEVSVQTPSVDLSTEAADLSEIVEAAKAGMDAAGLKLTTEQLLRFISALQSKRFLILTGLAGSGKTKLAQAFARWITPRLERQDPFAPGTNIPSDRVTYYVAKSDQIAVEFWNSDQEANATKVILPRELIQQWADHITSQSLPESTPARELRETVKVSSKFSDQLQSFETHLKAAAFALINSKTDATVRGCYSLVPVGADWTGNEHIIGYPDGLRPPGASKDGAKQAGAYISKPALELFNHAKSHKDLPHFLILDEMNLSHVERYFADLLSLIESKESVTLYCDDRGPDGLPLNTRQQDPVLTLPDNLFILGTVNIDETTYMFSPKVLDRANVLEFRVSAGEMSEFLAQPVSPDLTKIDGYGTRFALDFVRKASIPLSNLEQQETRKFQAEMRLFFAIFKEHGAEFGYRVANEAARFLASYKDLSGGKVWDDADRVWSLNDKENRDWFDRAFDAVLVQKLLPKLHGSKAKLGLLLKKIFFVCLEPHSDEPRDLDSVLAKLNDPKFNASSREPGADFSPAARYTVTAEKTARMWRQLLENGFTSFAEN